MLLKYCLKVIPVENCEDKENVLEETKESTHAEEWFPIPIISA
jgi:hypothetical protein